MRFMTFSLVGDWKKRGKRDRILDTIDHEILLQRKSRRSPVRGW